MGDSSHRPKTPKGRQQVNWSNVQTTEIEKPTHSWGPVQTAKYEKNPSSNWGEVQTAQYEKPVTSWEAVQISQVGKGITTTRYEPQRHTWGPIQTSKYGEPVYWGSHQEAHNMALRHQVFGM